MLYDLLTKKAVWARRTRRAQLEKFDPAVVEAEFRSLEMAAAAIGMASVDVEPMPAHLAEKIAAGYGRRRPVAEVDVPAAKVFTAEDVFTDKPRRIDLRHGSAGSPRSSP